MKFHIGKQRVTAKNDGGLQLTYSGPNAPKRDLVIGKYKRSPWPILSFETKRRKSQRIRTSRETTIVNHAAQIFAEMLGHVCHKTFYGDDENGYQELFVIYGRHDKFAVFYARLPRTYLRWVGEEKDKLHRPFSGQRIALKRSRFFLLRKPQDRANFFELIAKLVWYLCSGKSHAGFCHIDGPLRRLVMSFDLSN